MDDPSAHKNPDERDPLTEKIIGCAIEVHREIGPGVFESVYERCLAWELEKAGLRLRRQVILPIKYKGAVIEENGYRIDMIVEDSVILKLKTVDKLLPLHEAQLLTYLKLTGIKTGLLINFLSPVLRTGIKRMVV